MRKIGFIINPIAGMGGSVGLKGTDAGLHKKAFELGAVPQSAERSKRMWSEFSRFSEVEIFTASGKMGADVIKEFWNDYHVIGNIGDETSSFDTQTICRKMLENGIDLLVFAGGDGTARDVHDVIETSIPVIAVPAGVKIYSGVFSTSPTNAAKLLETFLDGSELIEEEVLDIDEDAYRNNQLSSRLYGYLLVPKAEDFLQHSKAASSKNESNKENQMGAAEWLVEKMQNDVLYLLGPGSTTEAIAKVCGQEKTLLGIDAMINQRIIAKDLNEQAILKLLKMHADCKVIVTPIGGNGYIFGRGNKQFTPRLISMIGKKNIILIGTKEKMERLKVLRVDIGDDVVDRSLRGYMEITIGFREGRMVKVVCDQYEK